MSIDSVSFLRHHETTTSHGSRPHIPGLQPPLLDKALLEVLRHGHSLRLNLKLLKDLKLSTRRMIGAIAGRWNSLDPGHRFERRIRFPYLVEDPSAVCQSVTHTCNRRSLLRQAGVPRLGHTEPLLCETVLGHSPNTARHIALIS